MDIVKLPQPRPNLKQKKALANHQIPIESLARYPSFNHLKLTQNRIFPNMKPFKR